MGERKLAWEAVPLKLQKTYFLANFRFISSFDTDLTFFFDLHGETYSWCSPVSKISTSCATLWPRAEFGHSTLSASPSVSF